MKITEKEQQIIDFINSSKDGKRYLWEFEEIIPVKYNKRYEWMIRGARLGKMVKKGLLNAHYANDRMRQYYYLPTKFKNHV